MNLPELDVGLPDATCGLDLLAKTELPELETNVDGFGVAGVGSRRKPVGLVDDEFDGLEALPTDFVVAVSDAKEAVAVAREELLGSGLAGTEFGARPHVD